ncbi:MAG TPA: SRPBCC family protein [Solirubrobacterales bacterium]|nr:SRPBCC family protein [Solirubrobacterales bacterium]
MRVRAVQCRAPVEVVWGLLARPDRWTEWSPHVRGAEGLGSPEVVAGASGHVVLRGGIRLPAQITEVEPGRSWSWEVGGLRVRHAVRTADGGSLIEHTVGGAAGIWSVAALAYAPIVGLIARNIARVAERRS